MRIYRPGTGMRVSVPGLFVFPADQGSDTIRGNTMEKERSMNMETLCGVIKKETKDQ